MRRDHVLALVLGLAILSVAQTVPGNGLVPGDPTVTFSSEQGGGWDVYAVDPDVGVVRNLTNDTTEDYDPSWSPDGQSLAFAARQGGFTIVSHIYSMSSPGDRHRLTDKRTIDKQPAWSPDGRRIAFSRGAVTGGDSRIFLMRSDGSFQRALSKGGPKFDQGSPTWSPDGHQIAYVSTQAGFPQIFQVTIDATGDVVARRRITKDQWSDGNPAWSPDGTRIAFERCCPGGHSSIVVRDIATGTETDITQGVVEASDPAWSPEGAKLAFTGYTLAGGQQDIYVANSDGTGLRKITNTVAPDFGPSWQPPTASPPIAAGSESTTAAVGVPKSQAPTRDVAPSATERKKKRRRYVVKASRRIAPGVRYERLHDRYGPNDIYVLKVDQSTRVSVDVALAEDRLGAFEHTSRMARRHHAVAAVNGDFGVGAPVTGTGVVGRPMHLFEQDGSLDQSMFGLLWDFGFGANLGFGVELFNTAEEHASIGVPQTKIFLKDTTTGLQWPVGRFNEGAPLEAGRPPWGEVEAYTSVASRITAPPAHSCSARLTPAGPFEWTDTNDGVRRDYTVVEAGCFSKRLTPGAGVVVSALPTDPLGHVIRALATGAPVTLRWSVGTDRAMDAIGGYPLLVDDGKVVAQPCSEHLCDRNPRTSVGVTSNGTVLLVAVDGRRSTSIGLTLVGMGRLMKRLGASKAMNIDGGGSTTMVVRGRIVNQPSDPQGERGVTSSILVLPGPDPGDPASLTGARSRRALAPIPPSATAGAQQAWRLAARDPGSTGGLLALLAARIALFDKRAR